MEWHPAENKEGGTYKIPERWLHIYYYEALNILFRFENGLRLFVYVILKKHLGKGWDLAALGEGGTIRTETKKRIAQAREHGYLGYDVSSPMLFLNGGELTQLIVSDAYWKYFAPYFKASKSIVLTKLQEIGTVRNSLAHFRPIKQDDIDLIKQNTRHLFISIEDCLVQITSITDVVPTNTEDAWYKELKLIGNDHLRTSLFSSRDKQWVRLQLTYSAPVIKKYVSSPRYPTYLVGNIRTDQILHRYASLREPCIYMSELGIYPRMGEDLTPVLSKQLSIVFSRATLEDNLAGLLEDLKNIALTIENETELISQDALALGDLVESKGISAFIREDGSGKSYWVFNTDALNTAVSEIDDVEYWGKRWHFATDFICSTSHYPWMPSSVSSEEIPF